MVHRTTGFAAACDARPAARLSRRCGADDPKATKEGGVSRASRPCAMLRGGCAAAARLSPRPPPGDDDLAIEHAPVEQPARERLEQFAELAVERLRSAAFQACCRAFPRDAQKPSGLQGRLPRIAALSAEMHQESASARGRAQAGHSTCRCARCAVARSSVGPECRPPGKKLRGVVVDPDRAGQIGVVPPSPATKADRIDASGLSGLDVVGRVTEHHATPAFASAASTMSASGFERSASSDVAVAATRSATPARSSKAESSSPAEVATISVRPPDRNVSSSGRAPDVGFRLGK